MLAVNLLYQQNDDILYLPLVLDFLSVLESKEGEYMSAMNLYDLTVQLSFLNADHRTLMTVHVFGFRVSCLWIKVFMIDVFHHYCQIVNIKI